MEESMIDREIQIITSPFGLRKLGQREHLHHGVDLRSVNFETYKDQDIITPEQCEVLRVGTDKQKNNYIVVKPLDSYHMGYRELKFIHVDNYALKNITPGDIMGKGAFLGYAVSAGTGKHLHFETWVEYTSKRLRPVNPVNYFIEMKIRFEYKGE